MEPSISQFDWAPGAEAPLLGQLHPLLEQLGSPEILAALNASSDALFCPKIDSLETLGVFLEAYQAQMLYALEWPAICQAHALASHNQTRELLALDRIIAAKIPNGDFARASRRVGQNQLQRLRPLRDQRVVQRYLEAVDQHQADGWHTVVYGLTLAVYSLPLRQGLTNYARQTLQSFIGAVARPLQLSVPDRQELLERQWLDVPAHLEKLLREGEA